MFVKKLIYNSIVNSFLEKKCKLAGIPVISVHELQHTHASLFLYAVSTANVARKLRHTDANHLPSHY